MSPNKWFCWSKLLRSEMVFLFSSTITSVHNSWRLWRLQKIWFIFFPVSNLCSAKENVKCKSDCNVGHMLVVGTVSIVMILIHQSRCTLASGSNSSVGLSKLLNDCLSVRASESQGDMVAGTPTTLFPHQPRPRPGLGCFSIWCRNEFFLNIRAVWPGLRCPGNGLISWQTVGNVFRISGQISRLYSPSVTFEFPAARGNHVRTGQY